MQPDSIEIRPDEPTHQPPQPPEPPRSPRRRSIVTPAILIILGVVFLLNNLGMVDWNVWEFLLKLWPVWLIAVGLDLIIGRRSLWGSVVALVAVLAIVAGSVFFGGVGGPIGPELASEQVSAPLAGATRANVIIHPSVGQMRIGTTTGDNLVEGQVRRLRGERISQDATATGGVAQYRLESRFSSWFPSVNSPSGPTWDLRLNTAVPLDLTIGSGVGESTLDLEGLQVTRLKLDTGVGETTITLPAHGQYRADFDTGIGQTVIYIPRELAASIRVNTGIGAADIDNYFRKDGGNYRSPDYDTAANRVDLVVDGGIGEIVIRVK